MTTESEAANAAVTIPKTSDELIDELRTVEVSGDHPFGIRGEDRYWCHVWEAGKEEKDWSRTFDNLEAAQTSTIDRAFTNMECKGCGGEAAILDTWTDKIVLVLHDAEPGEPSIGQVNLRTLAAELRKDFQDLFDRVLGRDDADYVLLQATIEPLVDDDGELSPKGEPDGRMPADGGDWSHEYGDDLDGYPDHLFNKAWFVTLFAGGLDVHEEAFPPDALEAASTRAGEWSARFDIHIE